MNACKPSEHTPDRGENVKTFGGELTKLSVKMLLSYAVHFAFFFGEDNAPVGVPIGFFVFLGEGAVVPSSLEARGVNYMRSIFCRTHRVYVGYMLVTLRQHIATFSVPTFDVQPISRDVVLYTRTYIFQDLTSGRLRRQRTTMKGS